jgi:hypothetical protein
MGGWPACRAAPAHAASVDRWAAVLHGVRRCESSARGTERAAMQGRIHWYTSMVGKKATLRAVRGALHAARCPALRTAELCQGRTSRWALAWSWAADARGAAAPLRRGPPPAAAAGPAAAAAAPRGPARCAASRSRLRRYETCRVGAAWSDQSLCGPRGSCNRTLFITATQSAAGTADVATRRWQAADYVWRGRATRRGAAAPGRAARGPGAARSAVRTRRRALHAHRHTGRPRLRRRRRRLPLRPAAWVVGGAAGRRPRQPRLWGSGGAAAGCGGWRRRLQPARGRAAGGAGRVCGDGVRASELPGRRGAPLCRPDR